MAAKPHLYMVEHLDEELGSWSALEYITIAKETSKIGSKFCLSCVQPSLELPEGLRAVSGFSANTLGVEDLFPDRTRVCLLDPAAAQNLSPEDGANFDVFLFGGILGDDPPRDRTSELRKKGYEGRRLGPIQMTTDTAVRVTRLVAEEGLSVDEIHYVDHPEICINRNESTVMPFRYVAGPDGKPIMPEGMLDLIKKDSQKGFGDLV